MGPHTKGRATKAPKPPQRRMVDPNQGRAGTKKDLVWSQKNFLNPRLFGGTKN